MSLLIAFMTGPTAEAIASALMHFLWQGAVLAAAAWIAMRRLTSSASARYVIGIVTLGAMLAMPVATFFLADARHGADPVAASTAIISAAVSASAPTTDLTTQARVLPFVTLAWIAGVIVLSVRLTGGWIVARRLTFRTVRDVDADIAHLAARVADRLGVRQFVRLAESSVVAVPVVVGWLKPVVIVPAAALSGLTMAQVEALFAHELAHIRRHDYVVNLLQSVVETLLFYHPAVWWGPPSARPSGRGGSIRWLADDCCWRRARGRADAGGSRAVA
jgi:beta-lactamase regulating signal transducer with metallopeptidase domain